MNKIYEREAKRLRVLETIYELSNYSPNKRIAIPKLQSMVSDISNEELIGCLHYLEDKGLIEGRKADNVGFIFVFLTAYGVDVMESTLKGQSTDDFSESGVKFYLNNINAPHSIVISNSSNISNISISINDLDQIKTFIENIKREVEELHEDNHKLIEAIYAVDDLLKSQQSIPKTTLKFLLNFIVNTGSSLISTFITPEIRAFLGL